MNVEITRAELRWDSKKQKYVSHKFNVAAQGLLKSQVNSLVRFAYAGMTSNSVGNGGIAELKNIISEAEKNGSARYVYDERDYIIIKIEKELPEKYNNERKDCIMMKYKE